MLRVVCILLLLTGRLHAQQPTEADRLFEEGRTLAKEKRFAEACDRFEKSYALDPTIGTLLNLADCHENLGHLRKAWELFEQAAAESEKSSDQSRTKFARERSDTVAARLATVVVHLPQPPPAAITITIAGRTLVGTATQDKVEPGEIEVTASVPDRTPFSTRVTAAAGATVEIEIPRFRAPTPPETPNPKRPQRIKLALVIGGVGAASGLAATILTIKARGDYNDVADGPNCDRVSGGISCNATGKAGIADAQHLADLGTGFAVGAGLLIGVATVVYVTAPHDTVRVSPVVTARGGGLVLGGSF